MSSFQLRTEACNEYDLTGDLQIPAIKLVQGADAILHMRARDNTGAIVDLTIFDEIKAEAKKRYTTVGDPIFSASLLNGKIVIVDAALGLFDVIPEPEDTDFAGTAHFQMLYHEQATGRLRITCQSNLTFCPSSIMSDILNPEEAELENFVVCDCPASVEVGDLVYQTATSGLVDQALASDPARIDVIGWVAEKPTTTTCKVTNDIGPVPSSGLTPGDVLYLSPTTPGKVTSTGPSFPDALVKVGSAKTVDSYVFTGRGDHHVGGLLGAKEGTSAPAPSRMAGRLLLVPVHPVHRLLESSEYSWLVRLGLLVELGPDLSQNRLDISSAPGGRQLGDVSHLGHPPSVGS